MRQTCTGERAVAVPDGEPLCDGSTLVTVSISGDDRILHRILSDGAEVVLGDAEQFLLRSCCCCCCCCITHEAGRQRRRKRTAEWRQRKKERRKEKE